MSAYPQPQTATRLSEEEYLATEMVSETKREYIDGQIHAMAGAGYNHNCISANLLREFRATSKARPAPPSWPTLRSR